MQIEVLLHNRYLVPGLCGLGAFAVVALIWSAMVETDPLPARLKNITERRDELRAQEIRKKGPSRRVSNTANSFIKTVVHKLKLEQGKKTSELRLKLARAGYRSREAIIIYLFLRLATPIAVGFVAFFVIFILQSFKLSSLMRIAALLGSATFGLMLPDIILKNKSQKREHILRKAMPDAMDLLVVCTEAGLSLDSALDRVGREIGPSCAELAEEIGLTSVELGFYPDRSRALQNFADRVPIQGVIALVNTLVQTEKYGTPLAQALRVLSSEMRDERIMAAETKAAKLPATLTVPMIVFILPPLFVVLLGPAMLRVTGTVGDVHDPILSGDSRN